MSHSYPKSNFHRDLPRRTHVAADTGAATTTASPNSDCRLDGLLLLVGVPRLRPLAVGSSVQSEAAWDVIALAHLMGHCLTYAMKSAADAPSARRSSQSPAYLFVASSGLDQPMYGSPAQTHCCCCRLKIGHHLDAQSRCFLKVAKDASSASLSHRAITSCSTHPPRLDEVPTLTQSWQDQDWVLGPTMIAIDVQSAVDAQEDMCLCRVWTMSTLLHRQSVYFVQNTTSTRVSHLHSLSGTYL